MKLASIIAVLSAIAWTARVDTTVIEVVNVNCGGHIWEPLSTMMGRANPKDRGMAPFAYAGTTWSDGFGWNRDRLKNSENKPTSVGFFVSKGTGFGQVWNDNKLNLLKGGWTTDGKPKSLEIRGLNGFQRYDLYLPSQHRYSKKTGGTFSTPNASDAGTDKLVSTGTNLNGATWVEGENYVVFRNIVPSEDGKISIHYSGTLNGFQLVRKEPRSATTTSLVRTAGAAKSDFGDPVTVTATVKGSQPTGEVAFFDGDTPLVTQVLDGASKASITTSMLTGGTHHLTARYAGDAKNAPSTSAPLLQSVKDNRPTTSSTLTLVSGTNPSLHGDAVTFTVTVSGVKPTGKVIFHDYEGKIVTPVSYYDSRHGKEALGPIELPLLGTANLENLIRSFSQGVFIAPKMCPGTLRDKGL